MAAIKITNRAYQKLRYYIATCPTEVTGFGRVRTLPEPMPIIISYDRQGNPIYAMPARPADGLLLPNLEIYDFEVLPQIASGAHATLTPKTLARFMYKKLAANERIDEYRVWWHSHVDFSAYFSTTDLDTIEYSTDFPYLISIVGNKRDEFSVQLDTYKPLRMTLPLILQVAPTEDDALREVCAVEIRQNVREKKLKLWTPAKK